MPAARRVRRSPRKASRSARPVSARPLPAVAVELESHQWPLPPWANPVSPTFRVMTLTFLLTDIEGSTRLWETHRQAMGEALTCHDRLVLQVVADHGGAPGQGQGGGRQQLQRLHQPGAGGGRLGAAAGLCRRALAAADTAGGAGGGACRGCRGAGGPTSTGRWSTGALGCAPSATASSSTWSTPFPPGSPRSWPATRPVAQPRGGRGEPADVDRTTSTFHPSRVAGHGHGRLISNPGLSAMRTSVSPRSPASVNGEVIRS